MKIRKIIHHSDHAEIEISKGYFAKVDLEDLDKVKPYRWYVSFLGKQTYTKTQSKGKWFYMHHLILNCPKGMVRDHINRNGLDNRKSNLRAVSHSTNHQNAGINKNNTCGYRGIYFYKPYQKWSVLFGFNKKRHFGGYYVDKEEAYNKYLSMIEELSNQNYLTY